MMTFNKSQVEKRAEEIRNQYAQGAYGLDDIFKLLGMMDIDFVRYPFDSEKPLGFSTRYKGRNIVVSNSSLILSREIFTVAHELGHIIFDFNDKEIMYVDLEDFSNLEKDRMERRAFYFANCLLMPEEGLKKYIRHELDHSLETLDALDIVRLQQEFSVSYSALVWRLLKIKAINEAHKERLLSEQESLKSSYLFEILGFNKNLLVPYEKIQVSEKYVDYIYSNYTDGIIPYSSFAKALSLMGVSKENIEAFKSMGEETDHS